MFRALVLPRLALPEGSRRLHGQAARGQTRVELALKVALENLLHDVIRVRVLDVEQLGNLVGHLHDDRPERTLGGELRVVHVEENGVDVVLGGGRPARLPPAPELKVLVESVPARLLGLIEPTEVQTRVENLLRIPRARQHDPLVAHVHQGSVELVRLGDDDALRSDGVALLVVVVHLGQDAGQLALGVGVERLIHLLRPVQPGAKVPEVGRVLALAPVAVAPMSLNRALLL